MRKGELLFESDAIVSALITLLSIDRRGSCTLHSFMCCIRVVEREVERELYGCYETKPRKYVLIFMSLWV